MNDPLRGELKKTVYVVLGTRGSLIKFLPILKIFQDQKIDCIYIDTCQHSASTKELRKLLDLKDPEVYLSNNDKNIKSLLPAFLWITKIFINTLFNIRKIFPKKPGVCLIHADNLTALIGALISKYAGVSIIHWEAGERTSTILKPFPEELIRRIIDSISDVNITMSDIAYQNLINENTKSKVYNVGHSGALDSIRTALALTKVPPELPDKFIIATIHRMETIYNKARMKVVVETLLKIAENQIVIWVVHENTEDQLKKFGYWDGLRSNPKIELRSIVDYVSFVNMLSRAEFVVTDGGGLQDEAYFLGVPCLLMMDETGKDIHPNICISKFDTSLIADFISRYQQFKTSSRLELDVSPADQIVEIIQKEIIVWV